MFRKFLRTVPALLIWFLISFFLWGFVFGIIRNPRPEKKVVVYADVPAMADTELAVALEENLPPGIKMIEVHPFFYAMFGSDNLPVSDLYLVRSENAEAWYEGDCFADLGELGILPQLQQALSDRGGGPLGGVLQAADGSVYGIKIYDAATGTGIAKQYIVYESPAEESADYYLCVSRTSVHGADGRAAAVACGLIRLD